MNETPDESPVFRWARGTGVRRSPHRWIGGVSAGLGERFGIDPILARGLVVVLSLFTGLGLLLYALAWALLPEPDGRIHLQEAGRGRWSAGMTGALVFFLLGLVGRPGPFGGWEERGWYGWWEGSFWTVVVVGGIVWLVVALSRRRQAGGPRPGAAPYGPLPSRGYDDGAAGPAPDGQSFRAAAQPPGTAPGTARGPEAAPPAGAGGGYGPSAPGRGAPVPYAPAPPRVPRPPSLPGPTVAVIVGVAVIVAGLVLLANLLGWIGLGLATGATALAAALTVLGFGLVGAAVARRSGGALTGLSIAALVPALAVGMGTAAVRHLPAEFGPGGQRGPVAVREGNEYTYAFTDGTVDLTGTAGSGRSYSVDAVFADVDVVVPADRPVTVAADGAFQEVRVDGAPDPSGPRGGSGTVRLNPGASGPALTVRIDGAFSNVTVTTEESTR